MRFKIIHETNYRFSSKVFLEPHYFRFKPRITPNCSLEHFNLRISPTPNGISEHLDAENNQIHFCWFEGEYTALIIESVSLVNSPAYNPFNFILHPLSYINLPFEYAPQLKRLLQPALYVHKISAPLIKYGERIKSEANSNTVQFITNLTSQIHADFTVEVRHEGPPHKPDKTFELKKGSCRDITWMQIQLLRYTGIAARFVSGYYYVEAEVPEYELHAWLEVFLPGAGWIGYDPSHGIAASNEHIPVASSAQYENTMPVTGSVRGSATTKLTTNLVIEAGK